MVLDPETGALVALYARTLSAISRTPKKGGEGMGSMTTEELIALAMEDPTLREATRKALGR
jgi:hypothetical protein